MPNSKKEAYEKTIVTLSSTALLKHQGDITLKDVVTEPQEILALFASKKQQDKGKLEQNCLIPNMPLILLWCARSQWNMDLKIIFSS